MLRLRILARDLGAPWLPAAGGFRAGGSRVEPFSNPFLRIDTLHHGSRTLFAVRERGRALAGSFDECLAAVRAWPLEWQLLVIDHDLRTLIIECGRWGTAPLYLQVDAESLVGSWDAAELRAGALDPVLAPRFLALFDSPYSRRTLFTGIERLTERATARWADGRLTIDYPTPAPAPRPHALREGADPPAIADAILTASMHRWLDEAPAPFGAELSGGLDSGMVAVAAAGIRPPLHTYGLLQSGAAGEGQRARREALIARFGFLDTAMPAHDYPPLAHGRPRVLPWEEIYYEATVAVCRRAAADGMAAMLSGIGGDELCLLHPSEGAAEEPEGFSPPAFLTPRAKNALQESVERAPRPAMSLSSIEGLAASAPLYLHQGLWPIAPLTTPELYAFARRLPAEWRRERRLSREWLARRGAPPLVTHPESTETFHPLFEHGFARAARPLVRELFDDSRLHDGGWIDAGIWRTLYDDYCEGRLAADFDPVPLYAAAVLELSLRRFEVAA
jgi:asparagine synthase (glutamine-hydrolysing)